MEKTEREERRKIKEKNESDNLGGKQGKSLVKTGYQESQRALCKLREREKEILGEPWPLMVPRSLYDNCPREKKKKEMK